MIKLSHKTNYFSAISLKPVCLILYLAFEKACFDGGISDSKTPKSSHSISNDFLPALELLQKFL